MNMHEPLQAYEFGDFRLDAGRRRLSRKNGEVIPLTPKAFATLLCLISHAHQLVTKRALMQTVWPHAVVEENNLNQHISALRRVLGERPAEHRYIVTEPGRGYRFIADVNVGSPVSQPLPGKRRTPARTVAVLPFKPVVPEHRNEALELGIADSLIVRLSTSREIAVRSLSAVRRFAALDDPCEAALQLGVDVVLDGTIQHAGDRVRVTTRLLEMPAGTQLWAEHFDERFTDLFAVQDSIASKVAAALALRLTSEERVRLLRHHTESTGAYRLYTLGRFHMDVPGVQSITRAIDCFEQALSIDPEYALAHAALSDCYTVLGVFGAPPHAVFPKARDAAVKALAFDAQLAEPHVALGHFKVQHDRDWRGAEELYRRAIALNPSCAIAHHRYAILLMTQGRESEAFAEIGRAYELDPASLVFHATAGFLAFWARRYEDAVQQLRLTIEMEPEFWIPHYWLAQALVQQDAYELALTHAETACRLTQNHGTLWLTAYVHGRAGRRDEARRVVERLESEPSYVPPYDLAQAWAAVGDADRTFEFLDRAYEDRSRGMDNVGVNPAFDPYRSDPRWHALLTRMGLQS
jgi:DNA-binding winged helix-turn-helix (wHTH) protein/tetratricopeptide (TPR) repeat protein